MNDTDRTRRRLLLAGLATAFGTAVAAGTSGCATAGGAASPARTRAGGGAGLTKAIPSSGEQVPVIGLGTNRFGVDTAEQKAPLREVLKRLGDLGRRVVDTAPGYGRSEEVIGELLAELGNRDRLFLATKITTTDGDVAAARAMLAQSLARLRTHRLDLLQVHSLRGVKTLLPLLREEKAAGRIRYYGVTTSSDEQYEALIDVMSREPLDFVQVDYSLGNRGAGDRILPLAREKKIAVLVNLPLGGRRASLMARVGARPVPDVAREFDATTWPQVFLKYVVSHPAVTCAIPGSTRLEHSNDNQAAASGRLPTPDQRRRLEAFWDALPETPAEG
jgi:aryl-alcohol dehydrogenase-like predicted oxidoreductase